MRDHKKPNLDTEDEDEDKDDAPTAGLNAKSCSPPPLHPPGQYRPYETLPASRKIQNRMAPKSQTKEKNAMQVPKRTTSAVTSMREQRRDTKREHEIFFTGLKH